MTQKQILMDMIFRSPVYLLVSVLSLEAVIALADPDQSMLFNWLSNALQNILPAISNFGSDLPNEHRAKNYIAITVLFFPVKIWCLYLWVLKPEERKWVLVTPLSGRSITSSITCLVGIVILTIAASVHIATFGDTYWTDPRKVSPLGQLDYSWILHGGLLMWLSWSVFNMTGLAIAWGILFATARDWVLYIKNLGWRK